MNGATAFVNGTDVQLALRRWRSILSSGLFRAIVIAAVAISTASSVSLDDGWRGAVVALVTNGIESWLTAAVATLAILLIEPKLSRIASVVPRYGLAGALASPAVLAVVLMVEVTLRQANPTPAFLTKVAMSVLITVAAIAAVAGLMKANRESKVPPEAAPSSSPEVTLAPPVVAFLRRLPTRLGRDLVRVSVYDHYVEAHTRRGHELILIRFADALAELDGYDGLQIHRSHWVARAAVRRVLRGEGRSLSVELDDGTRLPVSRSRESAVRDSGLAIEKDAG
jgi:DNA-binding LytR/AlgR family response regulator